MMPTGWPTGVSLASAAAHLPGRTKSHLNIDSLCDSGYRRTMSVTTLLIVILILALVGAFPAWPNAATWGYGPSGLLGLVLVVQLILMLTGRV